MTKVNLIRQSLNPVKQEDLEVMMKDYQTRFDLIMSESNGDMKKVHESTDELIAAIREEYKDQMTLRINMPTSLKQWKNLITEMGGHISIGTHVESGAITLVLMDDDDSGLAY